VTLQLCPRLFYWEYIECLTPRTVRYPLLDGTAIHAGLAAWTLTRNVEAALEAADQVYDTVSNADDVVLRTSPDELEYHQHRTRAMVMAYAATYPSEAWTVQMLETVLSVRYLAQIGRSSASRTVASRMAVLSR